MAKAIVARKRRDGGGDYGWTPGKAWWDYSHPSYPSGPDKDGWGGFLTARIYQVGVYYDTEGVEHNEACSYLAVSEGCHWRGKERVWTPSWAMCRTLEDAMNFCERDMVQNGILPPLE